MSQRMGGETGPRRGTGRVRQGAKVVGMLAVALGMMAAPRAQAIQIYEKDDFTLGINLRMQPRVEFERLPIGGGEWRRDFLVRRSRFGASGKMQNVGFKLEWKIDGVDQLQANPGSTAENAYIQYPLTKSLELRAGLYDIPFSRDRLTSDSKQLAVDRGAVSNTPNVFGLVDNGLGFHLIGKARGGHAEYAIGLFDNRLLQSRFQDIPMVVGRLDLNFGSNQSVFQDAHFGEDSWFSVGVNGQYQGSLEDSTGADNGKNAAAGIDGIIDVPIGPRRVFVRTEFNNISIDRPGNFNSVDTRTWMIGAGILTWNQKFQPIIRFDQVHFDESVGGATTSITYVGANVYQKGHNLKVQGDVRFESGTHESVDGGRLQAQIDF